MKNTSHLNGFTRILIVLTLIYSLFGIYMPYQNQIKNIDISYQIDRCINHAKIFSSSDMREYEERENNIKIEIKKCHSREREFREWSLREGADSALDQAKEKIYYIFYGWLLSYFGFFSIGWIVKGFKKG